MHKLLPPAYSWLLGKSVQPIQPMLYHAITAHGLMEFEGDANNDVILAWAREAGAAGAGEWIESFYVQDSTPWCGLFIAMCAARSGYRVQPDCLSARGWLDWGEAVPAPRLGDVLVFWRGRKSGTNGHVALYVGEDDTHFHVIGGNQGNAVSIVRISRERLLGCRRWPGVTPGPQMVLKARGQVSENEA